MIDRFSLKRCNVILWGNCDRQVSDNITERIPAERDSFLSNNYVLSVTTNTGQAHGEAGLRIKVQYFCGMVQTASIILSIEKMSCHSIPNLST